MFFLIPVYFFAAGAVTLIFGGASGAGQAVTGAVGVKLVTSSWFKRGEGPLTLHEGLDLGSDEEICKLLRVLAGYFEELTPYCKNKEGWQTWYISQSEKKTLRGILHPFGVLLEAGYSPEESKQMIQQGGLLRILLDFLESQHSSVLRY